MLENLSINYAELELDELYDTQGGFLTVIIGGVAYVVTAKALAGIVAGTFSIAYVIGQGWGYLKK